MIKRRRLIQTILMSGGAPAISFPSGCIAAYYPIGAASLAASYTNLANPGVSDATTLTPPTWDAVNGWKFDAASSQYLETIACPPDATIFVRYSNLVLAANGIIYGTGNDTWNFANDLAGLWFEQMLLWKQMASAPLSGVASQGGTDGAWIYAHMDGIRVTFSWAAAALDPDMLYVAKAGAVYTSVYIQAIEVYDSHFTEADVLTRSGIIAAL
jgi:hypothetical protein